VDYRFNVRYWLIGLFLLAFGGRAGLFSQEKERLDSLNDVANGRGADTVKINALLALSHLYAGIDDNKAFALAQLSLKKSKDTQNLKWIAFSFNRLGSMHDVKGQPDSATFYFLKGLKILEELQNKPGLAAIYQNMGVMHYYQKDFDKAIENYQKALLLRQQTGELNYVAQLFNNMGSVMRRKKEYDSAIVYYLKALDIKKGLSDKQSLASSLMNISVAYQYKADFNSAIDYVNKAIALCKETKNDYDLASCHIGLGEIFLKLKKTKEAKEQAELALSLAQKLNSNELLFNTYEEMALCDTLAGDHKSAFLHYIDAMYYKDQVYSKEKSEAVSRMQTFYETEKKDGEIKLLNADNEIKEKQQKYLLAILFLSLFLWAVALWAFFNKQKANRVLRKQKAEIENKTEQLKNQAAQIARLSSQMNPHFLFNALNSLQKFVLQKEEARTLDYINQLSSLMRLTLNNSTREYISISDEINYLALYLAFEKNLLGTDLTYTFETDEIDKNNLLIPPMLIQPLVENAVKHGLSGKPGEKLLLVQFETKNGILKITVRDNGTGRVRTKNSNHQSKALDITRSRLRAEFEKQNSRPEEVLWVTDLRDPTGTEVFLLVPLLEQF